MKITHIGIWTKQLEVLRSFYTTYFQGKSHAKYINPKKVLNLTCFISKEDVHWKSCPGQM